MGGNESLLELLDIYTDIIDQQTGLINQLTELIRKQATELHNIKTVYGLIGDSEMTETEDLLHFP